MAPAIDLLCPSIALERTGSLKPDGRGASLSVHRPRRPLSRPCARKRLPGPRIARRLMRHSDPNLTPNAYLDAERLDSRARADRLSRPDLDLAGPDHARGAGVTEPPPRLRRSRTGVPRRWLSQRRMNPIVRGSL